MRLLSRAVLLGTLAATAAAGPAMAADAPLTVSSSGKKGTLLLGSPTTFKLNGTFPTIAPTQDGNQRLKSIEAKLPDSLVFNPKATKPCSTASFIANGPTACPASSKLGTTKLLAIGPPEDVQGDITANATLFYGTGFTVLAYAEVDKPSPIKEKIVGELRSSLNQGNGASGPANYGLEMYIPITPTLQNPTGSLYPVIKSLAESTVTPPKSKKQKVKGYSGKVSIPLVGLGVCSSLPFQIALTYGDNAGNTVRTDTLTGAGKCK